MSVRRPLDSAVLCALLEPFGCPALIVDVDRRILAVNAEFRARFVFRPESLGARCHEILHGRASRCPRSQFMCPLEACTRTGSMVPAIHPHVGPSGTLEEQVLVRPILTDDGEVAACLATLRPAAPVVRLDEEEGTRAAIALAPVVARLEWFVHARRPILIEGEPGTGKSIVARAIHRRRRTSDAWGERNGFELTPVAIQGLWDTARKTGRGGTLYVRGVHNMPLRAQDALLEVLTPPARGRDWRLIACTDRDLRALTKLGFFRRALLNCFGSRKLDLPPLRDRQDELPEIAMRFLEEMGSPARVLTEAALERLRLHPFPGNLVELAQALRHASLLAHGGIVDIEHLPDWLVAPTRREPTPSR